MKVVPCGGVLFVVRRLVVLSFQGSRKVVCRCVGLMVSVFEQITKNVNADLFKHIKKLYKNMIKTVGISRTNRSRNYLKSFKNQ